jgi:lysophospholipase L1-like esterase
VFDNYRQAISILRSGGVHAVVQSTLFTNVRRSDVVNSHILQLNQELKAYCGAGNCEYVDLNAALSRDGVLDSRFSYDGVHLNAAGYGTWVEIIKPIAMRYAP